MHFSLSVACILSAFSTTVAAYPASVSCDIANTTCGPIPGDSELYDTYHGKAVPFPATRPSPVNATASGPAGPDDLLFQNLLAAEWVIYSLYQLGVETFNTSSFEDLGLPNTTYSRIAEIRDNEAGHLRIFQDSISETSLKPGKCQYEFPFTEPQEFLALQVLIEIASQTFLTGLAMEAKLNASKGALVGIAGVETRHNTWALIEVYNANPFTGPSETVYPYANQILDITNVFVVPGSCPSANPEYPYPNQKLPTLSFDTNTTTGRPGSDITFTFATDPAFDESKDYYAVFFHGVNSVSVPFDLKTNGSKIPAAFDDRGIIVAAIANEPGATTAESVVAGPVFILQQPGSLTLQLVI